MNISSSAVCGPRSRLVSWRCLVVLSCLLVGGVGSVAAEVFFDSLPSDLQLLPRGDDNFGVALIAGSTREMGDVEVEVRLFREDHLVTRRSTRIDYQRGEGRFQLNVQVEAGLFEHRLEVRVSDGLRWRTVAVREGIVAGDVYLVQGQSNAVATDYHAEQLANQNQRDWIRSFGSASFVPAVVENDLSWYVADGLGANGSGTIGAWALKMARLLSEDNGVPIAVLNGAVGGTSIGYHARDDSDPMGTASNYGRLLYRAELAGVRDTARALIWYQGESDAGNETFWVDSWDALYSDWRLDYPGLEALYLFQIRNACGARAIDMRETQRRAADAYSDLSVISTMGASGHDGCHFFFSGYDEMGLWLGRILHRDLYDGVVDEVDSPNVDFAYYSTPNQDEVTLVFRDADDVLVLEPGVEDDFLMGDGTNVVSATAVGNTVVLSLSGPSSARAVRYDGHAFDGPWFTNGRGVGALSFKVLLD